MRLLNFLIMFIFISACAFAQDVIEVIDPLWAVIGPMLLGFIDRFPVIATIIFFMGSFRFFMKPIMTLIITYVKSTPTKSDDEFIEFIKGTLIYRIFVYFLDWAASIKLPRQ